MCGLNFRKKVLLPQTPLPPPPPISKSISRAYPRTWCFRPLVIRTLQSHCDWSTPALPVAASTQYKAAHLECCCLESISWQPGFKFLLGLLLARCFFILTKEIYSTYPAELWIFTEIMNVPGWAQCLAQGKISIYCSSEFINDTRKFKLVSLVPLPW